MAPDPLRAFSPPVADWFRRSFEKPTPAQAKGWPPIAAGKHTLVLAPTGSGKTLAAFLTAIDGLVRDPSERGTRVLYVSPLKALNHDVERNLRAPLHGIETPREVEVAVRSGDTPQRERAAMRRRPPDILITTPESLYLILTSAAREMLAGVQTVIVDEIHALAAGKRGTHLALSLERLAHLTGGRSAADRALGDPAAARRDRPLPRRRPAGRDRRRRPSKAARPRGRRPGARHARAGRGAGRRRRAAPVDLARDLPAPARPRPRPPLDARLREQPPRRRARRPPPERPRRGGDRPRPPRLDRPRAAARDRGDAEDRPAARARRHVVARARDRHGRDRPRRPGRVAEVGRRRPPARRPRRPPRRRRELRPVLPQVPRRPARDRRRRGPDARGRDRAHARAAPAARRPRPAARRDDGDGRLGRRRPARAW